MPVTTLLMRVEYCSTPVLQNVSRPGIARGKAILVGIAAAVGLHGIILDEAAFATLQPDAVPFVEFNDVACEREGVARIVHQVQFRRIEAEAVLPVVADHAVLDRRVGAAVGFDAIEAVALDLRLLDGHVTRIVNVDAISFIVNRAHSAHRQVAAAPDRIAVTLAVGGGAVTNCQFVGVLDPKANNVAACGDGFQQ